MGQKSGLQHDITVAESTIMQPVEVQRKRSLTIQTANAVSVAASGSSYSSVIDADGFDRLAITGLTGAGKNLALAIHWSNDPSGTINGYEQSTNATGSHVYETAIKARYCKVMIINQDTTAAQTMSAWAYLKA